MRKWLPKSSLVATAEATMSSRTASLPITASRSISVTPADVRVVKILLPTVTQKSARKRSLGPTRSVRALGDSGAPSASRPLPSSAGSKKVVRLDLEDTLLLPPEAPQDDEDDQPQQQALELDELCGPLSTAKAIKCGSGWLYAGRLARLWPSSWATVAVQPVAVYGKRSPNTTKERPVTATSGRLIRG